MCSCDPGSDGDAAPADPPASGSQADAPTPAAPTAPVPSEPPPRGFAQVRGGAEVFAKPDASASIGTLPNPPPAAPIDAALVPAPASGTVVAVVGAQGEFIAVESLVDTTQHCAGGLAAWSDLRVGLFVRKRDLVQVTTREVEHTFADGTRVVVEPGAAIGETVTGAGERVVDGGGIGLELPLPADAIGTYYEPISRAPQTAAERVGSATLAYGQGRPLGPTSALDRDRDGILAFERKPAEDKRVLVRVGSRCAQIWAWTDASAVAPPELRAHGLYAMTGTGEAGILGLLGGPTQASSEIRAGAALTWPDGHPAGLAERAVTTTRVPRRDGERSCVVVPFASGDTGGPELCVAAADLKTTEAEPPLDMGVGFGAIEGESGFGGGLGLSGIGAGGSHGSGGGLGLGSIGSSKTPHTKVKPGGAKVHGSLDKDIIRRIVRAHLGRVRHCYEKALASDASLAGKVTVSFVIGADGSVTSASVKDSTLASESVESCVLKAVERMSFPKPIGGGVVAVSYPFVFASE